MEQLREIHFALQASLAGASTKVRLDQVEHVKNERNILRQLDHPFLLSLTWSCIDKNYLYLIFPYVSSFKS